MKLKPLTRTGALMALFLCSLPAYSVDNPIDTSDPVQVRAQAFLDRGLDAVRSMAPTQTMIGGGYKQFSSDSWLDGDAQQALTMTDFTSATRCPNCQEKTMHWHVDRPDEVTCANCGKVFPDDYPANATVPGSTWDGSGFYPYTGVDVTIPCYIDPNNPDDIYYFDSLVQAFKTQYLNAILKDFAYAYGKTGGSDRFAIAIREGYVQMAKNIHNFVPVHYDRSADKYTFTTTDTFDINVGGNILHYSQCQFILEGNTALQNGWYLPLIEVRDHPALQEVVPGSSMTYEEFIVQNFFRYVMQFHTLMPMKNPVENRKVGNLPGYSYDFVDLAAAYGDQIPEMAHWMKSYYYQHMTEWCVGYDGQSLEGAGYHSLWMRSQMATFRRVNFNHVDPPGYVYPITGEHYDQPMGLVGNTMPGERMRALDYSVANISLPDGSRCGVHDSQRHPDDTSQNWRIFLQTPSESKSFLLGAFVHSVLGDGVDDGITDRKVQTQLHASGTRPAHTSSASLNMQFYAFDRALLEFGGYQNYSNGSTVKNVPAVDHLGQSKYGGDIKGEMCFHSAVMPGLKAVRIDGDDIAHGSVPMEAFRRTLVQNTVDLDRPYVLDVFEVVGGGWHEYKLSGNLWYPSQASANIAMNAIPGDTPYYQDGDDGFWQRYSNVREGTIGTNTYVDFVFDDSTSPGLRMHLAPSHAGDTLKLSRHETIDGPYVIGAEPDRPHMIISRGGRADVGVVDDLASTFVVVHEAYQGAAKILSIESEDLPNNCLMVRVNFADRTDTYLIAKRDQAQQMEWGAYSADALLAGFSEDNNSDKRDMWMIGGTQAQTQGQSLIHEEGTYTGSLLEVWRELEGDAYDALVLDFVLPEGNTLAGQMLYLDGFDETGHRIKTNTYEVDSVIVNGGQSIVKIRQEPGVVLNADGSFDEIFYQHERAPHHLVRMVSSVSSIPYIAAVTPGLEHWRHEQFVFAEGRAFDQSVSPEIVTVPAGAEVRFSRTGQAPTASQYETWGAGQAFTDDVSLQLTTVNPDGLTVPAIRKEGYYKRRVAYGGSPSVVRPGLDRIDKNGNPKEGISHLSGLDGGFGSGDKVFGYLYAPETGYYRFLVQAHSGAELSIGGQKIFYERGTYLLGYWYAEVYLEEGWHDISCYVWTDRGSWLNIEWEGPSFDLQRIPEAYLAAELSALEYDHTLTYQAGVGGTIVGDATQSLLTHADGRAVLAQPDVGYRFVSWSDGSTSPAHQAFDVTGDQTFTATFEVSSSTLGFTREIWEGISGNYLADLTGHSNYPDSPTTTQLVTELDLGPYADNYGQRITAMIRAPVTGDYVFDIASDDQSELWLSTDATMSNLVTIASVPEWATQYDYGRYSEQTSDPISLVAGEVYYLQVLHKNGGGGDHCSVRWLIPGTSAPVIIDAGFVTDDANPVPPLYPNFTVTYDYDANHGSISGGAAVQSIEQYQESTAVTAVPLAGYRFIRWSDGHLSPTRQDTVLADATYTAFFEPLAVAMSYTPGANGTIMGPLSQSIIPGLSSVPVVAVPYPAYQFDRWSDGLLDAERSDVATVSGLSVTALFVPDTVPPVIDSLTGPTAVSVNEVANFSVTAHDDANLLQLPIAEWDLDADGEYDDATGWDVSYSYPLGMTGTIDVGVRVTDSAGNHTFGSHAIEVLAYVGDYLSDMDWESASSGRGSVRRDVSPDGNPMTLDGRIYPKGLSSYTDSEIVYQLGGAYTTFNAVVGVDDEIGDRGSLFFVVYLDGIESYRSPVMYGISSSEDISLDITGVDELRLFVDGTGDRSGGDDRADWAMARVLSDVLDVSAPEITSLTVPASVGFKEVFTASVTATDDTTAFDDMTVAWDLDADGEFDDAFGPEVQWSYDVSVAQSAVVAVQVRDGAARTTAQQAVIEIVAPSFIYLSDMDWDPDLSVNGARWGIRKDLSTEGAPIRLNGVEYERGLGVNADGRIVYRLNGGFDVFATDIGLDDAAKHDPPNPPPAVVFEVYLDGALLYRSDDMDSDSLTQSLEFGVRGGQILELVADRGSDGSTWEDQADWAGARVYPTAGPDTVAPVVTAITPGTAVQHQVTQLSLVAYDNLSAPARCAVEWDLDNDGQYDDATGLSISHVFTSLGAAAIGVQVTDEANNVSTSSTTVTVEAATATLPPVPTDMVAHWPLDETSGLVAEDAVGNKDGTLINGIVPGQAGVLDGAYALDGSNDAVDVPALNLNTNTLTVTAWLKLEAVQVDVASIFMSRDGSTTAGLNLRSSRELMYHWNDDQWRWRSGVYVPADQWVLVAWSVAADKATVHMRDGSSLQSATNVTAHAIEEFNGATYLGGDSGMGGRFMAGSLDDVRVFNRVLSPDEIEALYQDALAGKFGLSASAGSGGSISPDSLFVAPNANQTFTITPDTGHEIADVLVDGSSVGAVTSYDFTNVTRPHTISASFRPIPTTFWTVSTSAGTGGTISPSDSVVDGATYVVQITPDLGYRILDVTVDGVSIGARGIYALSPVDKDYSIAASFEALPQWTLTASVNGGNGTVSPATATVYEGGHTTFTMTPDLGYQVADVLLDGVSIGAYGTYTLANITTNRTIEVSFGRAPIRDTDGDGINDVLETKLGTDPNDPDSFFGITGTTPLPMAGKIGITWPGATGVLYRVWESPDLANWSVVRNWTNAAVVPVDSYEFTLTPSNGFFKVEADIQ